MFKIRHFAYVDSEVTPTSVLNIAHKKIFKFESHISFILCRISVYNAPSDRWVSIVLSCTHRTLTVMGTSPASWTWATRRADTWHRPTCCPSPYASTKSGRTSASTWASATTSWNASGANTGGHQIRAGRGPNIRSLLQDWFTPDFTAHVISRSP